MSPEDKKPDDLSGVTGESDVFARERDSIRSRSGSIVLRGGSGDVSRLGGAIALLAQIASKRATDREKEEAFKKALNIVVADHEMALALQEQERALAAQTRPAPREVLPLIRGGAKWMGIGCDRRARDHVLRPRDAEVYLRKLQEEAVRTGEAPILMIVDHGLAYNVFAELWRHEKNWRQGTKERLKTDDELWEESLAISRVIGARDKAYLEALQEVLFPATETTGPRVPIYLMSEVMEEHDEVIDLFAKIEDLIDDNEDLAERVWACVPKVIKRTVGSKAHKKLFGDLVGTVQDPTKEKGRKVMKYPAFEGAFILSAQGGVKWGNKVQSATDAKDKLGEENYDALAEYILERFGGELGLDQGESLNFEYPEVRWATGNVPYRVYGLQAWEKLSPLEVRALIQDGDSWGNVQEAMDDLRETWEIYSVFLKKIKISPHLNDEEKEELLRTEMISMFAEVVIQLKFIPAIEYLFREAGVLELIENLISSKDERPNIKKLQQGIDSSFICLPKEGESDEAYAMRFVYCLLSGEEGPSINLSSSHAEREMHEFLCQILLKLYGELEGSIPLIDFQHNERDLEQMKRHLFEQFARGHKTWEEIAPMLENPALKSPAVFWKEPYTNWCYRRFKAYPSEVDWPAENAKSLHSKE